MKIELAKDLFRDSWSRRDQLTSSTGTPISVLTGIAGGVAVLLASFHYSRGLRTGVFALAASICVVGLTAAAYFIARSYHGYVYQDIPNAADLDAHCNALHQYHSDTGGTAAGADADFDEYLAARFVEAADLNSRNNESKAAYLYRANQSLIVGIVSGVVAAIPWAVAKLGNPDDPQRVTIEAPVRVTLPPGTFNAAAPPKPATTPATAGGAAKSPNQRGRAASAATTARKTP